MEFLDPTGSLYRWDVDFPYLRICPLLPEKPQELSKNVSDFQFSKLYPLLWSCSLVQRSPTECGASLCVIKEPCGREGHSLRWAAVPGKKKVLYRGYFHKHFVIYYYVLVLEFLPINGRRI
jgi:hypothetical protein